MAKSHDKSRIAALIAAFLLSIRQVMATTEKKACDISNMADKAQKARDFMGLQSMGEALAKKLNKIAKITMAIYRADQQSQTIDKALELFKKTGDYCLTLAQARVIISEFSLPSKMPSLGYSLPAEACITGAILRKIVGSVCFFCYACKGNYQYIEVKACLYRRLAAISELDLWKRAFSLVFSAYLDGTIKAPKKASKIMDLRYFRFHDSGDIQSIQHLSAIVWIAEQFPQVTFWLPTKERKIVSNYLKSNGNFPVNLVVRVSMPMIEQKAESFHGLPMSAVDDPKCFQCVAPNQEGYCLDCRACWNPKINVSYHKH